MIPSRIAADQKSTAQHIARNRSDPNDIAKRHRVDDYVRTRMQEAGVDLEWSPSALFLGVAGSVVSLGAHLGGIIGVAMAIASLAISLSIGDRVARTRTRERSQAALPRTDAPSVEGCPLGGRPIDRAIRTVASEMTPLPEGVRRDGESGRAWETNIRCARRLGAYSIFECRTASGRSPRDRSGTRR